MFRPTIHFGEVPEARAAADLRRYEAWVTDEVNREIVRRYGSDLGRQLNQVINLHPGRRPRGVSRDQQLARAGSCSGTASKRSCG